MVHGDSVESRNGSTVRGGCVVNDVDFRMAARRALQKSDFVVAATNFLHDHSLSELTMRRLGVLMGVDATACYRHFRSKRELLTAMIDAMVEGCLVSEAETVADPRERLLRQTLAVRRAMVANPQLAAALAMSEGQMPHVLEISRRAIVYLRQMGLDGDRLVEAYQTVESYSMGATIYDLMAAPDNMVIRAARYRAIGDPAFAGVGASADAVADLTERAFVLGLGSVLDALLDENV